MPRIHRSRSGKRSEPRPTHEAPSAGVDCGGVAVSEHRLRPLLEPSSIAVVGASGREGTLGYIALRQALVGGFGGPVYPVNPRYPEILDTLCFPTLRDLPDPAEHVVLAVGNPRLEEQLGLAVEQGAKAATIFANAYLEGDDDPPLMERLRGIAREAEIPVCGANCLGLAQLEKGVRATWFDYDALEAGPISMITHSGTAYFVLAGLDPRMRYNMIVSPGQELVTTAADYLDYALHLESTRAIGLFLEAIRDPPGFLAALDRAREREIPVVALKVGRTELSARLARSHSGALAGDDAAYEAVFEHCGVQRVQSIDEMSATLCLLAAYPRLGPGGLGSVHDSGGLRGMVIDLADREGVPFARVSDATTAKLEATLDYGFPAVNPVDAWSGFSRYRAVFPGCLDAVSGDPDTALTLLFIDIVESDSVSLDFRQMVLELVQRTGRRAGLAFNWSRQHGYEANTELARLGIPTLDGAHNAVLAVKHAFAYRDFLDRPPIRPLASPDADVIGDWRARLTERSSLDEAESLSLLSDFGLPVTEHRIVEGLDDALGAARELGYPVVLKTAAPGIHHKSDVDGVKPGLMGDAALREAYADMSQRLGPQVLIASMAEHGIEVALGVVVDDQFGPLVMVGAGGLLVEVLRDHRFILPPIDDAAAERALAGLHIATLLDGVRGGPSLDRTSLCRAITRLGTLATALGDVLAEVDVNPVIVSECGCVAVDAVVVSAAREA